MLESSWTRCWHALNAAGDGTILMQKLLAAYQEPSRSYHTLQHLSECISLLDKNRQFAIHPGEVEIALWFHDAVYDATKSDNEAKSAAWATEELTAVGVNRDAIHRIAKLILATGHQLLPQGQDQQLLMDVDLSILGADRARFIEYEKQVRAEYHWVPEELFSSKSEQSYASVLTRNFIYNTPNIRLAYENSARENLAYSLAVLKN